MKIDVRKVPLREESMTPYEIMLSESQERMLVIAHKGHEDRVEAVFKKWGLNAVVIGEVTDDGLVHVYDGDELVAQIPAKSLADEAPTYQLDTTEPAYLREVQSYDLSTIPEPADYNEALLKLLDSPSIACKRWVYEQYDHMVQTNTAILPGSDAAVLRIRGTKKGVAMVTDCNGRYCYLDPFVGAQIAVAEAARNLACSGARPIGVTDCLNFGNPEKPEVFWQFKRAVEGMAEACEYFNAPVVSGNVSFYNETPEMQVYPTPVVAMVGLIEDVDKRCTSDFKNAGDVIVLISGTRAVPGEDEDRSVCESETLGGSEYLKVMHGLAVGRPPAVNLDKEKRVHEATLAAIEKGLISSAHDCSDGGLAVALAESCIQGAIGADVSILANCAPAAALFSETQSRIIVSLPAANLGALREIVDDLRVESTVLGKVGGDRLKIAVNDVPLIEARVAQLEITWRGAIPSRMNGSK